MGTGMYEEWMSDYINKIDTFNINEKKKYLVNYISLFESSTLLKLLLR